AIARARVRAVDAIVGPRDLVLGTAEALEAMAPFGNANPEVRLLLAGCEVGGMVRVGEGRHLHVRLRAGGAHLRAIGVGLGARAPAQALGIRDRRGQGAAVAALAALAGADGGVVAVVSDVARRRAALEGALEPGRLGAEAGVLGGGRCDRAALRRRLGLARGGP